MIATSQILIFHNNEVKKYKYLSSSYYSYIDFICRYIRFNSKYDRVF